MESNVENLTNESLSFFINWYEEFRLVEDLNDFSVEDIIKQYREYCQLKQVDECNHILGNDKQGMYVCKKCNKSLEKEVQDEREKNIIPFNCPDCWADLEWNKNNNTVKFIKHN